MNQIHQDAQRRNGTASRSARSNKMSTKSKAIQNAFDLDIMGMLVRRWHILLFSVVACVAAAIVYCFVAPPTYESVAQLLITPKNAAISTSSERTDTSTSEDALATHMMVVQSPRIVRAALNTLDAESKTTLMELPSLVEAVADEEDMDVDDYVIENLYVTRGGDGQARDASVIQVAFRHTDAHDCQLVLEAIVASFQTFLDTEYSDENAEAAALISEARLKMSDDIASLEDEYRVFQEQSPVYFNGEENRNLARERYELLETRLSEVQIERSEVGARLALVEQQLKDIESRGGNELQKLALIDSTAITRIGVFVEVINGKALTDHYMVMQTQPQQLEMARVEYETLLNLRIKEKLNADMTGESHPSVLAARNMRESAENYLKDKENAPINPSVPTVDSMGGLARLLNPASLVDAYVQMLRNDLASLTAREREFRTQRDKAEQEAKALIHFELEGAQRRRELERETALYDATIERLRDINMAKDTVGYINERLMDAELGEEVWPSIPICLAIAVMLGSCLGSSAALGLELTDRKIRNTADIEEILNVSVLSSIPEMKFTRQEIKRLSQQSLVDPQIVSLHQPNSELSEAYRGLRTSLLFKAGTAQAKIIAVSSPLASDGKTTTSVNMAISAARAGRRVLLVDCDLRRPSVDKKLGIKSSEGFAHYLSGVAVLDDIIHRQIVPQLDVITAGISVNNASELLASDDFASFLEVVRDDYDLILLDCPPVLAVADPAIVAGIADGMLLVVRVNPQTRQQLEGVKAALDDVDAQLLGVAVNASSIIDSRTGRYSQYYGYSYAPNAVPGDKNTRQEVAKA